MVHLHLRDDLISTAVQMHLFADTVFACAGLTAITSSPSTTAYRTRHELVKPTTKEREASNPNAG